MDTAEALALSRRLLDAVQDASALDFAAAVRDAQKLSEFLETAARRESSDKARATAELDAMRSEMHAELVDREANAARVADRQRFLFERSTAQLGQCAAADRATQSAAFVEAALVSLCPHTVPPSPGCAQLSECRD